MRTFVTIAVLLFASLYVYPQAAKPCEELKADIAKKMDANHVKSYTLDIVAKDKDQDKDAEGKVVGTCDGGMKKIVYQRNSTPPPAPAAVASKS